MRPIDYTFYSSGGIVSYAFYQKQKKMYLYIKLWLMKPVYFALCIQISFILIFQIVS